MVLICIIDGHVGLQVQDLILCYLILILYSIFFSSSNARFLFCHLYDNICSAILLWYYARLVIFYVGSVMFYYGKAAGWFYYHGKGGNWYHFLLHVMLWILHASVCLDTQILLCFSLSATFRTLLDTRAHIFQHVRPFNWEGNIAILDFKHFILDVYFM